jgi:hypothetical protein
VSFCRGGLFSIVVFAAKPARRLARRCRGRRRARRLGLCTGRALIKTAPPAWRLAGLGSCARAALGRRRHRRGLGGAGSRCLGTVALKVLPRIAVGAVHIGLALGRGIVLFQHIADDFDDLVRANTDTPA